MANTTDIKGDAISEAIDAGAAEKTHRTPTIDLARGVREALKKGVGWVLEIIAGSGTKKVAGEAWGQGLEKAAHRAGKTTGINTLDLQNG